MPKFLEDKLKAEYGRRGLTGRKLDRAVYGTLNNIGAMRGNQETAEGAAMDAKHAKDSRHPHKNLGAYLHPSKSRVAPAKRGSLAAHAKRYAK